MKLILQIVAALVLFSVVAGIFLAITGFTLANPGSLFLVAFVALLAVLIVAIEAARS